MILTPGLTFGAYKILAPLGRGGMGEVYRARDTRLGRDIAIKILREDGASDPERIRRFEDEARAASFLNHPNIVVIYEVGEATISGEARPTRYLAMELLEGQSLNEVVAGKRLPTRRFLEIAFQLADGLARAHEGGIVHRDLKPSNVVVSDDDHVKILDFGLAKLRSLSEDSASSVPTERETETAPGTVLGTVGYMSPEQVRGEPATAASDQFSLGCVLYEMLTGNRPFSGKSPADVQSAILRDDPPPITESNPGAPDPVCWIVERCLAKSPSHRYVSTRDLARDLQTLRAHSLESKSRMPLEAVQARRSRRWRVAGLAAALVLLGGAAALLLTHAWGPRPEPDFRRLTFRRGVVWRALFVPNSDNILYTASWEGSPTRSYLTLPESSGHRAEPRIRGLQLPMAFLPRRLRRAGSPGGVARRDQRQGTLAWRPTLGGQASPDPAERRMGRLLRDDGGVGGGARHGSGASPRASKRGRAAPADSVSHRRGHFVRSVFSRRASDRLHSSPLSIRQCGGDPDRRYARRGLSAAHPDLRALCRSGLEPRGRATSGSPPLARTSTAARSGASARPAR